MKSLEAFWFSFEAGVRRHRLVHRSVAVVALLSEAAVSALLYLARVRFLRLNGPGRIGHLAADIAMFVKGRKLGRIGWYYGIFISPRGVAANDCLLDYWRRYVGVVRSPFWARILTRLTRFKYLVRDVGILSINETAPYIAVEREWGGRPALLELTDEHRRKGRAWLESMGLPAHGEFVCFHSREAGYAPQDDAPHAFRNSSIENYLPAVSELTKRGFWCLRMGDPSMRAIPPLDRVIDYAHLDSRCDWLDVFLCASCRFFIGSSSGLLNLASVFGKPCAVANQAPLSHLLGFGVNDIAIPKLMWSKSERRHLSFGEVLRSDVGNFRYTNLFAERAIVPVENGPEEVRDLVLEMLERSQGLAVYTERDEELQRRFTALMRPGHYSYGGINRVGRQFLRKYESLL